MTGRRAGVRGGRGEGEGGLGVGIGNWDGGK